jgi:hypothetical protein
VTKEEILTQVVLNTKSIEDLEQTVKSGDETLRTLLNDHLHEHVKVRFWLFTFLITSNIGTFLSLISLIIYLLVEAKF